MATKDHWRDPSRIEWIESGYKALAKWCAEYNIKTVATPPAGAGN